MPAPADILGRLFDPMILSPLLLQWTVKATLLSGFAALLVRLARGASAAVRHGIWAAGVVGVLALPVASPLLPGWHVSSAAMFPAASTRSALTSQAPTAAAPVDLAGVGRWSVNEADGDGDTVRAADRERALASLALAIWAVGAIATLAWIAVGHDGLNRLSRRASAVADPTWIATLQSTTRELGLRACVRVAVSTEVSAPCVAGLVRPSILLPSDAATWTVERRRAVLLHELAHVRRRDPLTQLLARIASALLWFSPVAWYVDRRIRVEREHACDDVVLAAGIPPVAYADYLLAAARAFRLQGTRAATAVAMSRYANLEARLVTILHHADDRRTVAPGPGRLLVPLTLCLALPLAAMRPPGEQPQEPETTSPPAPAPPSAAVVAPSVAATHRARSAMRQGLNDRDSVYARLVPADGATELVLTNREIRYLFTTRGMRAIDSTLSSSPLDRDSRQSAFAGIADMRIAFPLADIDSIALVDRTLTLLMQKGKVRRDGRTDRGTFRVEAVPPADAQAFARAFAALKMHR